MYYLGQVDWEQIGHDIRSGLESEIRDWLERATGQVYEAIPEDVRRELERQYLARRLAEERARATAAAKRWMPLLVAGGLGLLLIPGRRR